jgi:hypothetical protein
MVKGVAVSEFRKKNHEELLGELKRLRVFVSYVRKNFNKSDSLNNLVLQLLKFPKLKYIDYNIRD